MSTEVNTEKMRITWGEFKATCEKSGIEADDVIDMIDIAWGGKEYLTCEKDEDFGWQIILDHEG